MTTLYIAGPMRGYPEFNFPEFFAAEEALNKAGYMTFNPARKDVERGFDPKGMSGKEEAEFGSGFSIREVLSIDTNFICNEADGLAVLPGWVNSKGAKAEVALAEALGLTVRRINEWLATPVTESDKEWLDDRTYIVTESDDDPHANCENRICNPQFNSPYTGPRTKVYTPKVVPLAEDGSGPVEPRQAATTLYKDLENRVLGGYVNAPAFRTPFADEDQVQTTEVRVTSSTGGQKGSKLARFDLIPAEPLRELAEHYGKGAQKYDDHNWRKGYDWSLSFAALMRHAWDFWHGQDRDPETGSKEMIAVAWQALTLAWFMDHRPEFDNRP